jgi:hypothetical protein
VFGVRQNERRDARLADLICAARNTRHDRGAAALGAEVDVDSIFLEDPGLPGIERGGCRVFRNRRNLERGERLRRCRAGCKGDRRGAGKQRATGYGRGVQGP